MKVHFSILTIIISFLINNSFVSDNKAVYRFKLTELLGKPLITPATFTVDGASTKWLLDFNNGKSVTYTIISGNQHDPMCGLQAKDSFGDLCEICIKESNGTTVTFTYSGKKLIYKGYYEK